MRNELEETKEQLEKLKFGLKNISRHIAQVAVAMIKVREMHLEKGQSTVIVTIFIKNLLAAHLSIMRMKIMDYASTIVALETNLITVSHYATGGTSKFLVIIATILDIVCGISLYRTQKTNRSREKEQLSRNN